MRPRSLNNSPPLLLREREKKKESVEWKKKERCRKWEATIRAKTRPHSRLLLFNCGVLLFFLLTGELKLRRASFGWISRGAYDTFIIVCFGEKLFEYDSPPCVLSRTIYLFVLIVTVVGGPRHFLLPLTRKCHLTTDLATRPLTLMTNVTVCLITSIKTVCLKKRKVNKTWYPTVSQLAPHH